MPDLPLNNESIYYDSVGNLPAKSPNTSVSRQSLYSPDKADMMADYRVAQQTAAYSLEMPIAPLLPDSPLSHSRQSLYSPNIADMMADYRVSRETATYSLAHTPLLPDSPNNNTNSSQYSLYSDAPPPQPMAVSEEDIDALKAEMESLRSQLFAIKDSVQGIVPKVMAREDDESDDEAAIDAALQVSKCRAKPAPPDTLHPTRPFAHTLTLPPPPHSRRSWRAAFRRRRRRRPPPRLSRRPPLAIRSTTTTS